jgi:hypothetical protein
MHWLGLALVAAYADDRMSTLTAEDLRPIEKAEVVVVADTPATELHSRARLWFAETYRSSTSVVQLDDVEGAVLIGKAAFPFRPTKGGMTVGYLLPGVIRYTVKVESREGRYRYSISDVAHEASPTNHTPWSFGTLVAGANSPACFSGQVVCPTGWGATLHADMKSQFEAQATKLVESLARKMAAPRSQDNW